MSDIHVRHCPRCVTDYRPDVAYCVDCGQELVDRFEESDPNRWRRPGTIPAEDGEGSAAASRGPAPGAEGASPAPENALPPGWSPVYFASTAAELGPLAARLAGRDINLTIQTGLEQGGAEGPRRRFELWVEDDSLAAALEEIRDPGEAGEPGCEAPGCGGPACGTPVKEPAFDPRTGYRNCPACGAPLRPGAPECPDCGLALGGEPPEAPGPPVEPT